MSIIDAVYTCVARVPLKNVTSLSNRTVKHRDYCLVKVRDSDGAEGIGFCYAGNTAGTVVAVAVSDLLAPVLIGQESLRVEGLWQDMYQQGLLHGRSGSVMRALSALDIALWDLNARRAGLPLHKFLGAFNEDTVPAYASGGYYLDGKKPDDLGQELSDYVSAGFKAVKMKVGRYGLNEEEARIKAARAAIGDDIALMLDANNAWRDLPTALSYIKRFESSEPFFIEEPFGPDDVDNHRRLAERTRIPVATGEIIAGRWAVKQFLQAEALQILQVDAAVCGGITEWRRIAATAASFGVDVYPHWFHDLHAHLVAAVPNSPFVEFFADDQVLNFRNLIDTQMEQKDGFLQLHQTPGLGFKFDPDAVATYVLDGKSNGEGPWTIIR